MDCIDVEIDVNSGLMLECLNAKRELILFIGFTTRLSVDVQDEGYFCGRDELKWC